MGRKGGGGALVKADTTPVCDGVKKMIWPRRQNTNLSRLGKAVHLLSLEMFFEIVHRWLKTHVEYRELSTSNIL